MTFEKERNLLRSFGKPDVGPNYPSLYDHNPSPLEAEAEAAQHKERCGARRVLGRTTGRRVVSRVLVI